MPRKCNEAECVLMHSTFRKVKRLRSLLLPLRTLRDQMGIYFKIYPTSKVTKSSEERAVSISNYKAKKMCWKT